MAKHIRGVNLKTGEAWDEMVLEDEFEARRHLDRFRAARGRWQENPVVHGIVDPETKIPARDLRAEGLLWAIKVVEELAS